MEATPKVVEILDCRFQFDFDFMWVSVLLIALFTILLQGRFR